MKALLSSKVTMSCMAILLATGQVGGCGNNSGTEIKPEPNQPETKTLLRGIPLSCYQEVGPKGIHPSITSSTVELVNFQSAQWAEISQEYARIGDLEQAIAIAENIEDDLTRSETLVELAGQLAARGEYESAKQLVDRIREYEMYRAKGLARIGRYYQIAGNNAAAEQMFSEAIAFTQTLDHEYIQPIAWAEIAIEYAAAGQESAAMEIVAEIDDENSQARALAGIAIALADMQSLSKALQIVATIADEYYQAQALTDIAQKVSPNQLISIVPEIRQIEDETNKNAALAEIVMIYIRSGQFDRAAQLTDTLLDDTWLLSEIIAEYAKTGQVDRIADLMNAIEMDGNEYWQNRAVIAMTNAYAELGDFDSALELANGIKSPDIKSSALMAIAQQYTEVEQYPQSLELFQNIASTTSNEAISYDIDSYFAPLVNCAIAR